MSQSIYGNHRSSYVIRTPCATRGPQTMTVESRSRDGGTSASNFNVNLSIPIQCEANQAIGYYLKEAHLPLSAWTINKGYDSFQIAFPLSTDSIIYDVHLKHGIYTAAEFAQMVQDALNLVTYNYHDGLLQKAHTQHNREAFGFRCLFSGRTHLLQRVITTKEKDWCECHCCCSHRFPCGKSSDIQCYISRISE